MRGAYLHKGSPDNKGCRGGVGSGDGDYDLEIGNSCNAKVEMVAMCTLMDEIKEFLLISNSPIAGLIARAWDAETKRLRETDR